MKYEFNCKKCGNMEIVEAPIKEGPPSASEVVCKICGGGTLREYSIQVAFLGDGWVDKDLRRERQKDDGQDVEIHEERMNVHKDKKKVSNEVLKERRKGKCHMNNWKKKNQSKWKTYERNMNEGIRGKD